MNLSKVERQRAKIKRLEAHLKTWQEWARALLDAPEDASGPALRNQIGIVWEATRARVDAEEASTATQPTWREAASRPLRREDMERARPAINGPAKYAMTVSAVDSVAASLDAEEEE